MARKGTLVSKVAEGLRQSLNDGTYLPNSRLPTEAELGEMFGVSRPTIRAALRDLEAKGLVRTKHGVGTFVNERRTIRAGLERLESITDSVRATGAEPGMVYQSQIIRHLLPDEAERMGLSPQAEVIELRRSILADGDVVAYSYDLIPLLGRSAEIEPGEFTGSIFEHLQEKTGRRASHAVAEVHAVWSEHIGWGRESDEHRLFLLLDQLHYDQANQPLVYSRTYFIEGRYVFHIFRSRSV